MQNHSVIFILVFTNYIFTNENIIKIPYFPFSGCLFNLQFNCIGSVILAKYKETFTLPKGTWCIAETHYDREKNIAWNEIWYEDEKNIKKVTWNDNCIPQKEVYYNVHFYRYFFSIRTIHSLTCGNLKPYINNGKKYSFNIKYIKQFPHNIKLKEFVFCKNIFDIFLPDEILFDIATYIDYKTLFCTLPSVSKQCEQFIKTFHTSFSIKESIELDKPIYTDLVILIMINRQNKIPINIFHDPRFSHKYFKEMLKKSVEQYLWELSLKLDEKNGTVLVFSETRTDKQFIELLQACSLHTKNIPSSFFEAQKSNTNERSRKTNCIKECFSETNQQKIEPIPTVRLEPRQGNTCETFTQKIDITCEQNIRDHQDTPLSSSIAQTNQLLVINNDQLIPKQPPQPSYTNNSRQGNKFVQRENWPFFVLFLCMHLTYIAYIK